jgi:hypothetical protein
MTEAEYVQAENLMRGKVARQETLRQMMQIDHDSKQQSLVGMLFAIYLSCVVDTLPAHGAAIVVVMASGFILWNGGLLLHRKWKEFVATEKKSQEDTDAWINLSLNLDPSNRFAVGLTGALPYALSALVVFINSGYQLIR